MNLNKKRYQKPEVEKLIRHTVRIMMNLEFNHRRKNTAFYGLELKP